MSKSRSLPSFLLTLGLLSTGAALTPAAYAANTGNTEPRLATAGQSAAQAAQKLNALADEFYERQSAFEPVTATYNGDNRFNDKLPMTLAPAVRARQLAMWRDIAGKLAGIGRGSLNATDAVTYDCLQYELRSALEMSKFDDHLMPVNQMDSIPVTLAHFASGQSAQPLRTVADYEAFLRRLGQLPAWIGQATLNMREGMRRGIVLPRALVDSALPQYQRLLADKGVDQAYYAPVKNFPAGFTDADKARLSKDYLAVIDTKVLPALRKFHQFLSGDYLAASRSSTGWSALPGGGQWYRAWVRDQTTTNLDPEQIHAIGLREVARIQSEFVALGPKLGYQGEPNALPAWVEKQAQFRPFKSEAEVLEGYRKIDQAIRSKLPQLFGKIPKAALDIRPEPEISRATASDHYSLPAMDGSRPGVFWAVINDAADYSRTGMTTLYLHEGQPGHHFHLATLQELEVPKFRKFGGNNAYTEGWALYAETLGHEMGLFENDPAAYFGHLSDEMLRATRLVVDTGMHAKGWTREQSIRYLQATLGYSEAESRKATERYMAWPGQALGYKIGSLKIMELRQRATNALGGKFDLRQFHDVVLRDGTLPLSLLEAKLDQWIADRKSMN